MSNTLVYVGTYTRDGSEGIYCFRYDDRTGELSLLGATKIENPSFLAINTAGTHLYAINEVGEFNGEKAGAISAFAIDRKSGALTLVNRQSVKGTGPCHVCLTRDGRYALVANYGGGSVCALPINADGSLAPASDFVQHQGSSVNPKRQQGPHAHSATLDAQNRFAYVADLGLDKVMIYAFANGKLTAAGAGAVTPGEGPRHFAFHPNAKFAYLINEIGNTVSVFSYHAGTGALSEIQNITTLPGDFSGTSHTADIHVSPDGKYLYGSNRGHDSIAIFAIDAGTGKLTPVGYESTRGENPRNFALDPAGNFLLAANQNTHNIAVFKVDKGTGKLQATGFEAKVSRPVCVKFLRVS